MIITCHGDNYFKLQAGSFTLLVDPSNQRAFHGAEVVLFTSKNSSSSNNGPIQINHAGEYEIKGVSIKGFDARTKNEEKVIYRVNFEEIAIGILSCFSQELETKTKTALKDVRILILSLSNSNFSPETAARLIKEIAPALIIVSSMHKNNIKPLLREFKINSCAEEKKVIIKAKDLRPGALEIKCLKY